MLTGVFYVLFCSCCAVLNGLYRLSDNWALVGPWLGLGWAPTQSKPNLPSIYPHRFSNENKRIREHKPGIMEG